MKLGNQGTEVVNAFGQHLRLFPQLCVVLTRDTNNQSLQEIMLVGFGVQGEL